LENDNVLDLHAERENMKRCSMGKFTLPTQCPWERLSANVKSPVYYCS
jgi:hypothetical protein